MARGKGLETGTNTRRIALKITIAYLVVGVLWILTSDRFLDSVASSADALTRLQTYKGWLYVLVTALLLYALIRGYAERLNRLLHKLDRSERRMRAVIESVPDILYTVTLPELAMTYVGSKIADALGFAPAEFLAEPQGWIAQIHDEDRHAVLSRLAAIRTGDTITLEYRMWHKDGSTLRWIRNRGHVAAEESSGVLTIFGAMRDVTELKEAEARAEYLAGHDSLTGLMNHHAFVLVLTGLIRQARRRQQGVACLVFGIDNLTQVNNVYGRQAGDKVLLRVAQFLSEQLRASEFDAGELLARAGGNHFAVAVPDTDARGAKEFARRVLGDFSRLGVSIGDEPLRVTARVAIAAFPEHAAEASRLLSCAERMLEHGRERGAEAILTFDTAERDADAETIRWIHRIRDALDRRWFVLHFQPILHIPTGSIRHFETLVRMHGDDGRLVLPGRFIRIAEDNGLIHQVDYLVLDLAIARLRQWAREGEDIALSVNLSGAHFDDAALFSWLERRLADAGINPRRLILEITETAAVRDLNKAVRLMDALKALGCRFALDDFGIGFTSFAHLRSLPVDIVKIDGSFVRNMHASPEDQGLVQAITRVAKTFGKDVIAEFVENDEALQLLRRFGVDYAQGYFVGKPRAEPVRVADFALAG